MDYQRGLSLLVVEFCHLCLVARDVVRNWVSLGSLSSNRVEMEVHLQFPTRRSRLNFLSCAAACEDIRERKRVLATIEKKRQCGISDVDAVDIENRDKNSSTEV